MRIILYLGKGGVGKTTTSAATALKCAQLGYRTLVASTDIAHSLADSLGTELQSVPTEVAPNLWAQEISVVADIHRYWDTLQGFASSLIATDSINRVVADELSSFPGMDEIVSLLHINRQAKEGNFDVVVVDAAPTGETIRLLTMPDTFKWYASHFLNMSEARMAKIMKPFTGRILKGTNEILEALEKLDEGTTELRETLGNPDLTSYRVVVQPEKMIVREAQRAVSYLGLFSYPVDSIMINKVMPPKEDEGEFYQQRYAIQQKYMEYIEDSFQPIPLWTSPYYAHEVVGIEALQKLADDCFGFSDPSGVLYRGQLQEIVENDDDTFSLILNLPFVRGDDIKLRKRGDELFITVGNFKREMILPTVLAKRKTGGAKLENGRLEVKFVEMESEPQSV